MQRALGTGVTFSDPPIKSRRLIPPFRKPNSPPTPAMQSPSSGGAGGIGDTGLYGCFHGPSSQFSRCHFSSSPSSCNSSSRPPHLRVAIYFQSPECSPLHNGTRQFTFHDFSRLSEGRGGRCGS